MATILLDDVTRRAIELDGRTPVEWCAMLPASRQETDLSKDNPYGSWILLGDARHPVYETTITLSPKVRYTRGMGRPGPQLVIQGEITQTVQAMLTGGSAARMLDHPALIAARILKMFSTGGYTYVNLEMEMHEIETSRDLKAELRRQEVAVDRILAQAGSRGGAEEASRHGDRRLELEEAPQKRQTGNR